MNVEDGARERRAGAASSRRGLQISAAAVVAICVAIIIAGLLRRRLFEAERLSPTDAQVVAAKVVVASALRAKGDDIATYRVTTGKRIRPLGKASGSRQVLQVALLGEAHKQFYLVDVGSNEIVVHAEIDSILDASVDDYRELVHLLGLR